MVEGGRKEGGVWGVGGKRALVAGSREGVGGWGGLGPKRRYARGRNREEHRKNNGQDKQDRGDTLAQLP